MPNIELPDWVAARLLGRQAQQATRETWLQARELGGRPDLEWAFPVDVMRGLVRMNPVMSPFYEPLSSWEEVLRAAWHRQLLAEEGVAHPDNIHVGLGLELFDGRTRRGAVS